MNKVKKQLQKSGINFIPEGWEYGTVADYFILGRGRVISQEEVSKNPGVYPVFSSQSANNGEMGKIDTYDFEGEKITWTTDGAYAGTVFYRDGKYNCTNVCGVLTAKESNKIHYGYFAYLLSTISKRYVSYIGNPKLMNDVFSTIGIVIPPYNEQKKITRILRTIDSQIKKTEATITKYKAIKQGLMQDLFTRGINVTTGKLRPRFKDAPELYKPSPLGMIPKEWTPCVLNNIFDKLLNGGTPPTNIPHYWQGNIPWVTGADFLESYEIGEIRRYVSPQAARETSTNIIPKGNILLVTRTGVGKLAIAPTDIAISQDITGVILDSDKVCASYFYYYLQVIVEDFKKLNQGTSINGIIRDDLVSYETAYPKQDEQNKITEILQSNDKLLKDEQDNLSKLNLLKKGLMSDLLSGKVRVQVDEEAVFN